MNMNNAYIFIAIAAILIAGILVFLTGRNRSANRLTPLAGLAFAFILGGIFFGEERLIGYSLMGIGVILAFVDIFNRSRRG